MLIIAIASGWVKVKEENARIATRTEMLQTDVKDLKQAYITQNELHRAEYRYLRQEFQALRSELIVELRALREQINEDVRNNKDSP
jgi:uncharacterized coiled-coil DUF342 family protein